MPRTLSIADIEALFGKHGSALYDGGRRESVTALQHALQGGPMSAFEVAAFEATPFAMDAVQLRRWDDLAKAPDRATPPLGYYLALLAGLQPDTRALSAPSARQGA